MLFKAIVLASLLAITPALAQATTDSKAVPACEVSQQASTVRTLVKADTANSGASILTELTGSTLQAFLGTMGVDKSVADDIELMIVVKFPDKQGVKENDRVVLFAFSKGCYVGSVPMLQRTYNAVIERTKAQS